MKKMTFDAITDNFASVQEFVDGELETAECPMKIQLQIDIAIKEIFVNIARYAYTSGTGKADVTVEITDTPKTVFITFSDSGRPYNPLEKSDPDITLSAEERQIGGLGIFMVKKSMNEMRYEYLKGRNNLTLVKKL